MIRDLIEKLTGFMAENSHSARKKHNLPIKITFDPVYNTGRLNAPGEKLFIAGETNDLSRSGIGFIVSSIRVRENYLVGQERKLTAEIDLPDGKIRMKIIGRRYEKIGVHLSTERFLIGAEIVEINKENQEVYEHFLKYGKRKKATSPSLEMGGN